jgi:hypothetical protein
MGCMKKSVLFTLFLSSSFSLCAKRQVCLLQTNEILLQEEVLQVMEIIVSCEPGQRIELLREVHEELIRQSRSFGSEITLTNLVDKFNKILIALNFQRTYDSCRGFALAPCHKLVKKNPEAFLQAIELQALFLASNQEKYLSVKDILRSSSKRAKQRLLSDMFTFLGSIELGTIEKGAVLCLFLYISFRVGCWKGKNGSWLPKKLTLNYWNNSA